MSTSNGVGGSMADGSQSLDDKILDAAAELATVLGKRIQMSEIARRAGVSRPTVYQIGRASCRERV